MEYNVSSTLHTFSLVYSVQSTSWLASVTALYSRPVSLRLVVSVSTVRNEIAVLALCSPSRGDGGGFVSLLLCAPSLPDS